MTDKYNFANVDPAHGDVEISGALNGKGEASKSLTVNPASTCRTIRSSMTADCTGCT